MAKAEVKNAGFILLHRSIRNHWIWKDANKYQWWCDILMECNHSNQKVSIGFDLIECKRGQSLNSLLTWSKMWRVDVSTVRRFFKLLENDKMIVTENVQKTTRLTVCNYGIYNDFQQAKQFQNNSEAIPTQFARNSDAIQTNNELNNDINNEVNNVFTGFSPEQIEEFKKFENWILKNAPNVSKLKQPFTIKNFFELKNKGTPREKLQDVLLRMHNYKKLLTMYVSAYLTAINWIKKDEKNGTTHLNGIKPNSKTAGASSLLRRGSEEFNRG